MSIYMENLCRLITNNGFGYVFGEVCTSDRKRWPKATAAKHCRCSKTQVPKIMNKLMKLGAVTKIQEGKRGANSSRAAIYRREI